jgi:ribosomal protein L37E
MPDQIPCPDCGSPVQPEREQLCANCGYPLMFLRRSGGGGDASVQAVPRSPGEAVTRQSAPAVSAPVPAPAPVSAPGQVQCRACGYPNEPVRFRCERCGEELRPSRPQARVLAPPPAAAPARRGGAGWLIALIVLAVLAIVALVATVAWRFLG